MTEIQGKSILVRVSEGSSYRESTVVATVCHRYEILAVLQNIFAIILLEQEKTLKNVSKKLYSSKIKKTRRSRDEN